MIPLEGQSVLVTGATGDIGQAIVREIASCGGYPIVHCVNRQKRAQRLVDEIGAGTVVAADLDAVDGAANLWQACLAQRATVDAVVLNAGRRSQIAAGASWEDWHTAWRQDYQLNLQSSADLCRLACQHFSDLGAGKIVAIASRAGQRGYAWDAVPYGVTKAGLINLMKSLAISYGPQGIVAVSVAPGWVESTMARDYISHHSKDEVISDIPMKAMATPAEIGEFVSFLLRPTQRSINGATFDLNGGSYVR